MNIDQTPLSYGIRQAIRDSKETTHRIASEAKVSPHNLYRFLDENHPRGLSQRSIDSLGLYLKLKLTLGCGPLTPGYGKDYRITLGPDRRPIDFHKLINGLGDVSLSEQLGRAVKLHRKPLGEIHGAIGLSMTQLYRFLDGTRGFSLTKLDALCSFLGLVVEGPPIAVKPLKPGAMTTSERRIYRPRSVAQPPVEVSEKGEPSTPPRPPFLYLPPADPIDDNDS